MKSILFYLCWIWPRFCREWWLNDFLLYREAKSYWCDIFVEIFFGLVAWWCVCTLTAPNVGGFAERCIWMSWGVIMVYHITVCSLSRQPGAIGKLAVDWNQVEWIKRYRLEVLLHDKHSCYRLYMMYVQHAIVTGNRDMTGLLLAQHEAYHGRTGYTCTNQSAMYRHLSVFYPRIPMDYPSPDHLRLWSETLLTMEHTFPMDAAAMLLLSGGHVSWDVLWGNHLHHTWPLVRQYARVSLSDYLPKAIVCLVGDYLALHIHFNKPDRVGHINLWSCAQMYSKKTTWTQVLRRMAKRERLHTALVQGTG